MAGSSYLFLFVVSALFELNNFYSAHPRLTQIANRPTVVAPLDEVLTDDQTTGA
jgi:hypothetical protein